jgi:hypothetical protein
VAADRRLSSRGPTTTAGAGVTSERIGTAYESAQGWVEHDVGESAELLAANNPHPPQVDPNRGGPAAGRRTAAHRSGTGRRHRALTSGQILVPDIEVRAGWIVRVRGRQCPLDHQDCFEDLRGQLELTSSGGPGDRAKQVSGAYCVAPGLAHRASLSPRNVLEKVTDHRAGNAAKSFRLGRRRSVGALVARGDESGMDSRDVTKAVVL